MKFAMLASGGGSNAQALMEAALGGQIAGVPALVLSNNPGAGVLARAEKLGVPHMVVDHRSFETRAAFDAAIGDVLKAHEIDLVCLAGFMRILTPGFVESWSGRMVNIHPSLLPKYPGLNTHARALAAGDAVAGCTVHLVIPELDAGPILGQREVPILPGDTPDALAARVLKEEHRLYPETLARFIDGL